MKLIAYLAGPIAGCTDEECKGWRTYVKEQIPEIQFHDPMRRDYRNRDFKSVETASDIVENDLADIDESDIVLVYHDRPSVGTSMEVFYAYNEGKYVLTIDKLGVNLSPWMIYHSSEIVKSLEEAIEKLRVWSQDEANTDLQYIQEDIL